MDREDGDVADLRRRLESVEQQVSKLQSASSSGSAPGWVKTTGRVKVMEPSTATTHLHDALDALQAVAKTANDRLLFVASADAQTGSSGGPCSVRRTAGDDETAQALVRVGAAVSNPLRVKLLQSLVLHNERTTADLAVACGTNGGNLYQHLNELHAANLIYQPGRGGTGSRRTGSTRRTCSSGWRCKSDGACHPRSGKGAGSHRMRRMSDGCVCTHAASEPQTFATRIRDILSTDRPCS